MGFTFVLSALAMWGAAVFFLFERGQVAAAWNARSCRNVMAGGAPALQSECSNRRGVSPTRLAGRAGR